VAYKLSKKNGFDFVECDVRFTSDGVPVLLHDASINRTARNADGSELSGTINIADITYTEALNYDFGISKGAEYAGTKIPTLTEFMRLCRALSLHPYLDVYDANSNEKAQTICDIIASCGMERNVTFLSSAYAGLSYIANILPDARYGLVSWEENPTTGMNPSNYINVLKAKGVTNIFVDADLSIMNTSLYIAMCKEKGVALEVYCPNTEEEIIALDAFITGVTSDSLVAKDVLYNNYID
jgi:glycerophosphoryl diester phosphodiesterase